MLPDVQPALPLAVDFAIRLILIGVILARQRPNPPVMLSWIVLILVFPIVGFILYLLIGEIRLGRRRIRRHRELAERLAATAPTPRAVALASNPDLPTRFRQLAGLGEAVSHNIALGGNTIDLISDTDGYIGRMVHDIGRAEHHCHVLSYIYLDDNAGRSVAEALCRAAERGVACRVLVDAVGSKHFLRSQLRRQMEDHGVQVVAALPASFLRMLFSRVDLRNHRKITVIDGTIGYTGSQNIAHASFAPKRKYAPWVDLSVRIEGPVTRDLQMLFVEDWYLDTNESLEDLLAIEPPVYDDGVPAQIMGTGPNAFNEALRQLTQAAFHTAGEELILTTPYFVPDESTVTALCTAARRGVETTVVVPARNDSLLVGIASRSYYERLLESGVRVYEYLDGLLHAKTMTIDRDLALISTANLDRRSFELNFEVSLTVFDSDFASQVRFRQRSYLDRSVRIDPADWRDRGWSRRLAQNAAGLLSPLL